MHNAVAGPGKQVASEFADFLTQYRRDSTERFELKLKSSVILFLDRILEL